jgi:hypothetical protein
MGHPELRAAIRWHRVYTPAWDDAPDDYVANGLLQWGKSRRLGMFERGPLKAYVGVQHVDPQLPGWAAVADEPHARFFVSLFIDGQCVALRTVPTMDSALEILQVALSRH